MYGVLVPPSGYLIQHTKYLNQRYKQKIKVILLESRNESKPNKHERKKQDGDQK